jgi:hypothetical protein
MGGILDSVIANLSRIIRNILPGFLIIGAAAIAYPSGFQAFDLLHTSQLIVITLIAFVVGNIWLSFHRYGVHQLVDLVFYFWQQEGPVPTTEQSKNSYADVLGKYVVKSLRTIPANDPVRHHLELRTAGMHLMYIASEVSIAFTFFNRGVGILGFIITIWQNWITRRIDWYSNEPYIPPKKEDDCKETEKR